MTDSPEVSLASLSVANDIRPDIVSAVVSASDLLSATRVVLAASDDDVRKSLKGLLALEPSTTSIADDEISHLATTAGVPSNLMQAVSEVARVLAIVPDYVDPEKLQDRIIRQLELPEQQHGRLKSLLGEFKAVGETLLVRFNQQGDIAAIMPTFTDCEIACDIRFLAGSNNNTASYVPVAIVRVKVDESGRDVIFQLNAQGLARLQRAVQAASVTLQQLSETLSVWLNRKPGE